MDDFWKTWDGWKIQLSVELPDKSDTLIIAIPVHKDVDPCDWIDLVLEELGFILRRDLGKRGY